MYVFIVIQLGKPTTIKCIMYYVLWYYIIYNKIEKDIKFFYCIYINTKDD